MDEAFRNIPRELLDMLKLSRGYSLLVKGEGGTGKTTLALELLVAIKGKNATFISTRVSPEQLFDQFPWVQEEAREINVFDATQTGMTFDNPLDGEQVAMKFAGMPSFLRQIVNIAESNPQEQQFIVLDSWDALQLLFEHEQASSGGMTKPQLNENLNFMYNAFMSLVREYDIKLILVAENVSALDYLVDGVVELDRVFLDDGRKVIREILIKKFRGIRISNTSYVFTLEDGRFTIFPPWDASFLHGIAAVPKFLIFEEPTLRLIYETILGTTIPSQVGTIVNEPGSPQILDAWIENLARLQLYRNQLFTLMPPDAFDVGRFKQNVLSYARAMKIDETRYYDCIQIYPFQEPDGVTTRDRNVLPIPLPENGFFKEEDLVELIGLLQANLDSFMTKRGYTHAINFGALPALMSRIDTHIQEPAVIQAIHGRTMNVKNVIFVLATFPRDAYIDHLMKISSFYINITSRHGTPLFNVVIPYVRYSFGLKIEAQEGRLSMRLVPIV